MIEYTTVMWELAIGGEKQGVVFFAVVYLFLLSGYSFFFQLRVRSWPSTIGTLTTEKIAIMSTKVTRSDSEYKVSSIYNYRVCGVTYEGSRVSPWIVVASHNARFILKMQLERIQKIGNEGVVVYYNPKKPVKSYLIRPEMTGLVITFALAIVPISWYYVAYHR